MKSFRLPAIFYVLALVGASLAAFGPAGICVSGFILGFWAYVFAGSTEQSPPSRLLCAVAATIGLLLLVALLLPPQIGIRVFSLRSLCRHRMHEIAIALHNYHDEYEHFPPTHLRGGDDSQPILSWRALILPFLGDQVLYDELDLSKPWDDLRNRNHSDASLPHFQCPTSNQDKPTSDFLAVVGRNAAFVESRGRKLSEFTDGTDQTIMLIESHTKEVPWAAPRDLTFTEAVDLLASRAAVGDGHPVNHGYFHKPTYGRWVAFADGHVEFLAGPLKREHAAALLTVNGGEEIPPDALDRPAELELNYANSYAFALFVALALLPAVRVILIGKRQSATPAGDREGLEGTG